MPLILTENLVNPDIINRFLKKFRRERIPEGTSNIPTACLLLGRKIDTISALTKMLENQEIYIYWDQGNKLRRDQLSSVIKFLSQREPWEDYDFCIFPITLSWCVGITHDNHYIIVEEQ